LDGFGIRLNQTPPNIILKRKEKGGVSITKACTLTKLDAKMIKDILKEYKVRACGRAWRGWAHMRFWTFVADRFSLFVFPRQISNCDITFRDDANVDQLIDVIEGNRKYTPALYVMNSQSHSERELESRWQGGGGAW
jgi:ribosome-interacting GTPase 1